MAVPKQKQSHSRTAKRRATHKAPAPSLVPVKVDGVEHHVPRRIVDAVKRGLVDPVTGKPIRDRDRAAAHDHDH